jgi:hypothetical protein
LAIAVISKKMSAMKSYTISIQEIFFWQRLIGSHLFDAPYDNHAASEAE